jgi:3-oxoacyl-[acyl-carrier-protein] synthase-3
MVSSEFNNVKISGICTVVPAREICIDDELDVYGSPKNIARMKSIVGINTRRVIEKGVTASDLSRFAAEKLIEDMGVDKDEIDALIFVVQKPDFIKPATSFYLHKQLGLTKKCAVFDVNHGCPGYTYGLWIASFLVQSKTCKKVLLLVADTPNALAVKSESVQKIFGDAGSATLVEYSKDPSPSYYSLGSDGTGYDALIIKNGLYRNPYDQSNIKNYTRKDGIIGFGAYMDGLKIFDFAMEEVPASILEVLELARKTKDEIDCFVLHQANKYILKGVADKLGIPVDRVPYSTLAKYGNLSSASVPSVICDVLREKVTSGKQTVVLSGFGIGLAWATCVMDLEKIYCSKIVDYEERSKDE